MNVRWVECFTKLVKLIYRKTICGWGWSVVVVGLVAEDGHGAVELFGYEETDHLVAEGHA